MADGSRKLGWTDGLACRQPFMPLPARLGLWIEIHGVIAVVARAMDQRVGG